MRMMIILRSQVKLTKAFIPIKEKHSSEPQEFIDDKNEGSHAILEWLNLSVRGYFTPENCPKTAFQQYFLYIFGIYLMSFVVLNLCLVVTIFILIVQVQIEDNFSY